MSLRTLYDEASLWMTPSGYEDGKLFSELPTDGSGDFTFSRGSNLAATRVGLTGLIEKGRENLLTYSNDFSNAAWTLGAGNIVTSGQSGYDGTNDAWEIQAPTSNFLFRINNTQSGVQTLSLYIKKNASYGIRLYAFGTDNANVYYDLNTGVVVARDSDVIDDSIIDVGNDWWRITMTYNQTNTQLYFYVTDNSNVLVNGGTHIIQDAQLEIGLVATDYIETGASTAQAGILEDMPRLDYSGGASCPALLLEPQRTNLVVNSEYSVNSWGGVRRISPIANAGTSPEGLNNATKIDETAVNGTHMFDYNFTATSGVTYTFSYFAKAGERNQCYLFGYTDGGVFSSQRAIFDLSNGTIVSNVGNGIADIKPFNDGWYRVSLTLTAQASSQAGYWGIGLALDSATSYLGVASNGIYMYGFQHEAGNYPTSYIPTYGSSVTRSVDGGYTDYQDELTSYCLLVDLDNLYDGGGSARFVDKTIADISIHGGLYLKSGAIISYYSSNSGYLNNNLNVADGARHKYLLRVTDGFIEEFFDGSKQTDTGTNSTDKFDGLRMLPTNQKADINQLVVFPTALTDSECIKLTTI